MDHFSGETITHPVLACADAIEGAVKQVSEVSPAFMSVPEKRAALLRLGRLRDQVDGLLMSVMANSDDVAEIDGARSVAAWLAPQIRAEVGACVRSQRLGEELAGRYRLVAAGVRDGRVNIRQAEVIVRALSTLGSDVRDEVRLEAEATLVEYADQFGPTELRRLGDRILEIIDPETFEDEERKKLEAEQRKAAAATRLTIRRRGDGTTDISGRIPEALGARLKTYLESFTSPRHDAMGGHRFIDPATGQRLPYDRVLGEAFCSLLESMDAKAMPVHGGSATRIVVTIDIEKLRSGLGCGTLSDGTRITAGEVRRLACNAGIVPAVLGGRSEVLDLGRSQRLFTAAQRQAMAINQPRCAADGCDVPATWCEAHHRDPWSRGGRTDLADGVLLCPWHHHRAHDDRYLVSGLPGGGMRFHRRT